MSIHVKSVSDGNLREFIYENVQDNSTKIWLRLEFPVNFASVTDFWQILFKKHGFYKKTIDEYLWKTSKICIRWFPQPHVLEWGECFSSMTDYKQMDWKLTPTNIFKQTSKICIRLFLLLFLEWGEFISSVTDYYKTFGRRWIFYHSLSLNS